MGSMVELIQRIACIQCIVAVKQGRFGEVLFFFFTVNNVLIISETINNKEKGKDR